MVTQTTKEKKEPIAKAKTKKVGSSGIKKSAKVNKAKGKTGKSSVGMEATVYSKGGKESGKVKLPESVFGVAWNGDLVHQVVVSMQSNARTPVAHTKDRSEVRGGGKKPWRQKGTGRARHGSRRSPIWIGGGVTFGPRNERDFTKKINKKMRAKALFCVLSKKYQDGEIIFVDNLSTEEPKTKEAKSIMDSLGGIKKYDTLKTKKKNKALIMLTEYDENTAKSFRNFGNIGMDEIRNLNPVIALTYKYLIIANPEKAIETFSSRIKK